MQILEKDFVAQGIAIDVYEDGCTRPCSDIKVVSDSNANTVVYGGETTRNWSKSLSMDKRAMVCTYATALIERFNRRTK